MTSFDTTFTGPGTDIPDLDWPNLAFGYLQTDYNIRHTWRDGRWSEGKLTSEPTIPLHISSTCLHYGQECFEGLKAYQTASGDVVLFRVDENASRLRYSCRKILMPEIPEEMFIESVMQVVDANRRFVPPYGTGASLYIRPLVIGSGPILGVRPSEEYTFLVFVTPVGPYFKTGFKPLDFIVEEDIDRAAPLGVGDAKVGGNYAASLRAGVPAKKKGYADVIYLDAREKKYIDESGPANFFAITKEGQYITPDSPSILLSITNKSLITLAGEKGLNPQRRRVAIDEIVDFTEAGCCGTAAVITPIGSITWKDKKIVYAKDGKPGPHCTELYNALTAIQVGDAADPHGWVRTIPG